MKRWKGGGTLAEITSMSSEGKKPTVVITIGMAGSGKTTFMQVRKGNREWQRMADCCLETEC